MHPIKVIRTLQHIYTPDLVCHFSRWHIGPPGVLTERVEFAIQLGDITETWLSLQLSTLSPLEELGLNSRVDLAGNIRHIPMIDFDSQTAAPALDTVAAGLAPQLATASLMFFKSGRSHHAYCPTLLAERQWYVYLGCLLRLNPADGPRIIDARWIGYALYRGYSTLRWSNNTPMYLSVPRHCHTSPAPGDGALPNT